VECLAKAGSLGIVGVYSGASKVFPIGEAMAKNLTVKMGNCNHRKDIPMLLEKVRAGAVNPAQLLTQHAPFPSIVEAYQAFDQRQPGWVELDFGTPPESPQRNNKGSVMHA
jgi:threonine dehydrogenase-like Zn-dependent dehydrogenase